MTPFDLSLPDRVIFGPGRATELPALVAGLGHRVLVCTGSQPRRHAGLVAALGAEGAEVLTVSVSGEPTVADARAAVELARTHSCDVVVGIGGGSVLDMGKAVAILQAHGGDPADHLEIVGRGLPFTRRALPYVAVPTTAGSGSEATSNAVLGFPEHRVKVSLRSPLMLARVAVVDPLLTLGVPPATTAAAGMDALTQCLEPYVSRLSNPATDVWALDGLRRVSRSLRAAYVDGSDIAARTDLALGSLFGGLALSNAKLGAVHGIAGPFGGMVDAPHGAVCAALLPAAMEVNLRVMGTRDPDNPAVERYRDVAVVLTGHTGARPEDAVAHARELTGSLNVVGLGNYGLASTDVPELVDRAQRSNSMKGNPVELTREEITEIVERST